MLWNVQARALAGVECAPLAFLAEQIVNTVRASACASGKARHDGRLAARGW